MKHYVGPLEGITNRQYRLLHRKYFPGADKYYAPFLSPTRDFCLTRRLADELTPELDFPVPLVPQLLTNSAESFISAARQLGALGFGEVNFNLGCPSRTVTAKNKGAGLLRDPRTLHELLDGVFTAVGDGPPRISVKTRMGVLSPDEFPALLEVFNRFPIVELTIHARVQEDFYKRPAAPDKLAGVEEKIGAPFCYNGDILTAADGARILQLFHRAEAVMLGRGIIADPALIGALKGDKRPAPAVYRAFHDELTEAYQYAGWDQRSILCHMKEIWDYMAGLFTDSGRAVKAIRKANTLDAYRTAVGQMFQLPFSQE